MTFIPLSADELSWMRRDENASMTDRCTIQRRPGGGDATGAPSKAGATYANLYVDVPCRFVSHRGQVQGDEVLIALQKANINTWSLIVAWNTDLRVDDQVIGSDGIAYLVLGHSKVRTNNTKLTAFVKEAGA